MMALALRKQEEIEALRRQNRELAAEIKIRDGVISDLQNRLAGCDRYTYRVAWSPDDQEFAATCDQFPSLSWLAGSEDEALRGIQKLVLEVAEDIEPVRAAAPDAARPAPRPSGRR